MLPSPTLNDARPQLEFSAAGPSDVDAVVALVESAYRGEASRAGWTTEADLLAGQRTDRSQVMSLIRRPRSVVLLARSGGRLVGCCHLEFTEVAGPREVGDAASAYFGMFAVSPAEQGAGVGRALITEATGRALDQGCAEMRMTVIRQRPDLIAWYRRLGFEPTGETEPFPYGDESFGRPLRDDLEFVVLSAPLDRLTVGERRSAARGNGRAGRHTEGQSEGPTGRRRGR